MKKSILVAMVAALSLGLSTAHAGEGHAKKDKTTSEKKVEKTTTIQKGKTATQPMDQDKLHTEDEENVEQQDQMNN